MRNEFSTFRGQLLKPGGDPSSRSTPEMDSRPATPVQGTRRILQTFIPTKVFIPADNPLSRIASDTASPIGFLIPGRGARGIPLRDLLEGDAVEKMAWHDMFFFQSVEYGEIDLYLSWPGYPSHASTKTVDLYENGVRMPLKALAREVAKFVSEYMRRCDTLECLDRYAKWRISEDNVWLGDVTIVSLVNTHNNIWQPELAMEKSG